MICEARTGRKPYSCQLDRAEVLGLGIYCINVLAGTGFGTALPFTIASPLPWRAPKDPNKPEG